MRAEAETRARVDFAPAIARLGSIVKYAKLLFRKHLRATEASHADRVFGRHPHVWTGRPHYPDCD